MLRRFTKTRFGITAVSACLIVTASVTVATAGVIVNYKPTPFAATFDARAVGDPSVDFCRDLPAVQKLEGRYGGTMTVGGEEYAFNFTTLEALVDTSARLGSAEGQWQLADPHTRGVIGRGELVAVVTARSAGELQLRGLMIGTLEPPNPDLEPPDPDLEPPDPDLQLIANFTATLGDGATFPHLKGAVGDPSVGDPSVGDPSSPAVLLPAIKC